MANTINDKLQYLEGTKTAIKDAIVAKGVQIADSDTFRSYADKIGKISGGGKIDMMANGITFAYCNITDWKVFKNFQYYFSSDLDPINFFNNSKINAYVGLDGTFQSGVNFSFNSMFEGAKIHQISIGNVNCNGNLEKMFLNTDCQNINANFTINSNRVYASEFSAYSYATVNWIEWYVEPGKPSYRIQCDNMFSGFLGTSAPSFKIFTNDEITLEYMNVRGCFANVTYVTEIPEWDFSNVKGQNWDGFFGESWDNQLTELTTFGGIINLSASLNCAQLPSLNLESVTNIINKAAYVLPEQGCTLTFAQSVYDQIDEGLKQTAISKNWTIAAA